MVGISAMADIDISGFEAQLKSFQQSDEARNMLFADMLNKYTTLLEEHANLKNDYASERDIRRNYQKSVDQMQRQVDDIQREMDSKIDSNSFVLALIDGDGFIFQDTLLQAAGSDGGSEAASRLQYAIREHIASLYGITSNWPIMLQIYVSLDRLAHTLAQAGLVTRPQELRVFAQSFSVNQALFSIIDVGPGKERADHKMREMLRTFSDNPTCRHIIFGGSHDQGYLNDLDQYKHNMDKAARITLLESTPAHRRFTDLPNFQRTRFDDVFKSEPLPDIYAQPPVQAQPPIQPPLRTMSNKFPSIDSPKPTTATLHTPTNTSPSTTASSLVGPSDNVDPSWAVVGKAGTTNGNISIEPSSKAKAKKKYIYYNKENQRLDEPLPPRDRNAANAIDERMEKAGRNLCNHWHLNNGKCHSGSFCDFQHDPKLTAAELNALRYKTRSLACKDRYCENFYCYLGHQCSFERDQGRCPYPKTCNLRHTHGMDKAKYERWDEDGNVDYAK